MHSRVHGGGHSRSQVHPAVAYRQRGAGREGTVEAFNAPELWHEPREDGRLRFISQPSGTGFVHAVSIEEVRQRLAELPKRFTERLEVVQFSAMTRKRRTFPCYGMQWGAAVYLYPIEADFTEHYSQPPRPQQEIEARMFGGQWSRQRKNWTLQWTAATIRDFYLNNVLIHEVGHLNDDRNTNSEDRERYANWFAIEYGYRTTRSRRASR